MANPPGEAESGPWASTGQAVKGNGNRALTIQAGTEAATSVAAHGLLSSLSTVLLGAATLDESWETLTPSERRTIAARLHRHATEVAEQVKEMVRHPFAPSPRVIGARRAPAQVRVRVQGPLDGVTGAYLREVAVGAGVEPGREEVLLDLYAVTSMDPAGAAAVLQVHRELTAAGVSLAVTDASQQVRRALETSDLRESNGSDPVRPDLRI